MTERVKEKALRLKALELLDVSPNGFMTTTELISKLDSLVNPKGEDTEILLNRNDTKFSQKVRNLVSHRNGSKGLDGMGLAKYDKERKGLEITSDGRAFLA